MLLSPSFTTGIGSVGVTKVNPDREAVPPAVTTSTVPEEPSPTSAMMLVEDTTLKKEAAVPPKLTEVAAVKLLPVMVTAAPVVALAGVNEAMDGEGIKVNPPSVAIPPGVVTATFPEAPSATMAVIMLADNTVKEAAAVPPKVTAVAPVK